MLKVVEIPDQTGIVYLREGDPIDPLLGRTVNVLNPTFSRTRTGEHPRIQPDVQPEIPRSELFYQLLSAITGAELHDTDVVFVLDAVFDQVVTGYRKTFKFKISLQPKTYSSRSVQESLPDTNSVSAQAERLRAVSGLRTSHLAKIFPVSRTTYQNWLTGAKAPHQTHRELLLEVLPLMEEAVQRLGSPSAVSNWLLTPVSPGGKKPIDYLKAQQFSAFRGFLLQVRTGREVFLPFTKTGRAHLERSKEDIEAGLERLRPRAWKEEAEEDDELDDKKL